MATVNHLSRHLDDRFHEDSSKIGARQRVNVERFCIIQIEELSGQLREERAQRTLVVAFLLCSSDDVVREEGHPSENQQR